jgi:hypothetical protein
LFGARTLAAASSRNADCRPSRRGKLQKAARATWRPSARASGR